MRPLLALLALGRITFARFLTDQYRPTMVSLAASTRGRDESYLRTHILPTFGVRPLASIDYAACQSWVNELSTRKALATVVKAAQIMGKVMKTAVRARMIPHNPMAEVSLPTITESEDVYLTPAQVGALGDAMDSVAPRYLTIPGARVARLLRRASASCWRSDGRTSTSFVAPSPSAGRSSPSPAPAWWGGDQDEGRSAHCDTPLPGRGRARAAPQRVSLARSGVHVS